jgi:hypothetical protein
MLIFSVANGAMNAPRQWECLTDDGTSENTWRQREWESSFKPLKKPTDKNTTYPYSTMNFHSHVGNLFPNSQQLYEMTLYL